MRALLIRWLLPLLLVSGWSAANAQSNGLGPLVTREPVRWQGETIAVGDGRAQLRQVTRRAPDREVPLIEGQTPPIGLQQLYVGRDAEAGRLLWVELIRGRISRVWVEAIPQS